MNKLPLENIVNILNVMNAKTTTISIPASELETLAMIKNNSIKTVNAMLKEIEEGKKYVLVLQEDVPETKQEVIDGNN